MKITRQVRMGIFRLTYHNTEQSPLCLSPRSTKNHDQCIMMRLFIYFFIFGSFFFFFFLFFRRRGRGVGGTHAGPVVVRFWHTCVIHVQTLWSSQSIFMLLKRLAVCIEVQYPLSCSLPIATTHREIRLRLLELHWTCVCMFVYVCVCVYIEGCPLHKGLCYL